VHFNRQNVNVHALQEIWLDAELLFLLLSCGSKMKYPDIAQLLCSLTLWHRTVTLPSDETPVDRSLYALCLMWSHSNQSKQTGGKENG
jgi:hypothetical protein